MTEPSAHIAKPEPRCPHDMGFDNNLGPLGCRLNVLGIDVYVCPQLSAIPPATRSSSTLSMVHAPQSRAKPSRRDYRSPRAQVVIRCEHGFYTQIECHFAGGSASASNFLHGCRSRRSAPGRQRTAAES